MACATNQTQWTDFYFRHNFADLGCYPTAGSLSHAPDIIPAGTSPVADPKFYIEDAQWDKDLGGNTFAQLPNYIYLRGKNLGTAATDGSLFCYFSPARLLLWPVDPTDPNKGWSKTPMKTSKGASSYSLTAVGAGKRFVSEDPFLWIAEPLAGDHYCLISRVVTLANPNPIPAIGDITSFGKYISEHPNMAWRNVSTINPSEPISSRTVEYSQGDKGGETIVTVVAEKAPLGSQISFTAGTTTGTSPPLSKPPETIGNIIKYTIAVTSDIVANYTSLLTYSWYSKGKTPLPGMKISVSAVLPVDSSSELFDRACDLRELDVPADVIDRVKANGVVPKRGIRLGSYQMQVPGDAVTTARLQAASSEAAALGRAFMAVNKVAWLEESNSVLGTKYIKKALTVTTDTAIESTPQTVTLKEAAASADAASEQTEVSFNTGTEGGSVFVYIKTENVAVGTEVSFEGGTSEYPIKIGKRKVDNATSFTAGNFFDLPAELQTTIVASFFLNGKEIPSDGSASLELGAKLQIPEGEPAASSKLLGKVTTILG